MTVINFAYLSQGKLFINGDGGKAMAVESVFGREVRQRAIEISRRNSWKTEGTGAKFQGGGLLWGMQQKDPSEMRVAITGACWSSQSGRWLYALETDDIAGLFALEADGSQEQRLFHTSDFDFRDLNAEPDGDLVACSLVRGDFTNLAVIRTDGKDFNEITEGDSVDLAPSWIPGKTRALVFQSAGIARDQKGQHSGRGPFTIQELSLDTGDMTCLTEEKNFDLLGPKMTSSGDLYYIRRPYKHGREPISIGRFLLDILLFPFRVLYAIFQWLSFFSVRYTGRPLSTSGGAKQRDRDVKQMMIWGNLIDAGKAAKDQGEDAPSLVPKSWELMRQDRNGGANVIAKGVLSFDLCADDSIIYSNGSAVYHVDQDGRSSRVLKHDMIEQVVASAQVFSEVPV